MALTALVFIVLLMVATSAAIYYLSKTVPTPTEPLGIPRGSVRSLLALLLVFIAAIALLLLHEIPEQLLLIVSMVTGYYFGTRSASKQPKHTPAKTICGGECETVFTWHIQGVHVNVMRCAQALRIEVVPDA